MKVRSSAALLPCVLLFAASTLLATPANAKSTASLEEAETAYAEVDLEKTYTLALAALSAGGHGVKDTARLYLLYAVAAAATDRGDEAREAFLRVLAINGGGRLDKNLSPKIRAPYLEARGTWADAGGGKSLGVTLVRRDGIPLLAFSGPLGAASRVVLKVRRKASGGFVNLTFTPAEHIELPRALSNGGFEYVVHLEDAAGNRLLELGTETSPRRFGAAPATPLAVSAEPARDAPNPVPYRVGAAVLATLGLGSVGTGLVFQSKREDAAKEWNSSACETPGVTRGAQCAAVGERRADAEHLAIGFYAGGGALLLASAVTLLLAPDTGDERSAVKAAVACGAAFASVACAGRF